MKIKQYIDPEMRPALERMTARMAARTAMSAVSIDEMRARARADFAALNIDPIALPVVSDSTIVGAFGENRIRIYDRSDEGGLRPGLIYFHGGGWIVGDLDTEDAKLRRLAAASGARIVSVDYALAPEHKFPGPLEDCIASVKSIFENARALGLDRDRLALGGASAGANLALASAIALRDEGLSFLRYLVLFYGVFNIANDAPSRTLFNEGYGMGSDAMEFFYSLYIGDEIERTDPRVSPLLANLAGLPSAFINAAGLDVLRDDSRLLAAKLEGARVVVAYDEPPGVIHGFTLLAHEVSAARRTIENAAHALRSALS